MKLDSKGMELEAKAGETGYTIYISPVRQSVKMMEM
jgi:hypothetical protein